MLTPCWIRGGRLPFHRAAVIVVVNRCYLRV